LTATFASLGIEAAECSILSKIIDRVPINLTKLH
jgi:hypothetical protein